MYWMLAAALTLLFDQASKHIVLCGPRVESLQGDVSGPRLRPVRNRRPGLGLIRSPLLLFTLWLAASAAVVILLASQHPLQHPYAQVGAGLAMGGAASNLIDLAVRGAVVDFIDLRVWPVFNIADAAIVSGAVLFVLKAVG